MSDFVLDVCIEAVKDNDLIDYSRVVLNLNTSLDTEKSDKLTKLLTSKNATTQQPKQPFFNKDFALIVVEQPLFDDNNSDLDSEPFTDGKI